MQRSTAEPERESMQAKASHNHTFSPRFGGDIRRPSLNASVVLLCQINRKRHCHVRVADVRCTLAARATVDTNKQADIEAEAAAGTDAAGSATTNTIEGQSVEGAENSASLIQDSGVERKQAKPTAKPVSVSSKPPVHNISSGGSIATDEGCGTAGQYSGCCGL